MRAHVFLIASALVIPPTAVLSPDYLVAVGASRRHAWANLGVVPNASAAVSILMSLDELVAAADLVVVGTATEHYSRWEELAGGKRIVTYTRMQIEQPIAGQPSGDVWVRTLGGVVGKVGQAVSGEAQLSIGTRSLLFLTKIDANTFVVTGLAQGHFPIVEDDAGRRKLAPSPDAGALLPRRGPSISARELLVGTTIDAAVDKIQRSRRTQNGGK